MNVMKRRLTALNLERNHRRTKMRHQPQFEITYDNHRGTRSTVVESADDEGAALRSVLDAADDVAVVSMFTVLEVCGDE